MTIDLTIEQAAAIRDALIEWLHAGLGDPGGWDSESRDALTSGLEIIRESVHREALERGGF